MLPSTCPELFTICPLELSLPSTSPLAFLTVPSPSTVQFSLATLEVFWVLLALSFLGFAYVTTDAHSINAIAVNFIVFIASISFFNLLYKYPLQLWKHLGKSRLLRKILKIFLLISGVIFRGTS